MLWFIINGLLGVFGLFCIVMAIFDDYDRGEWIGGSIAALLIALIMFGGLYCGVVSWQNTVAQFNIAPQTIENKIAKINEMRSTYYEPPKSTSVNIDMVNKDLAQSINNEIKDLEQYINQYNSDITYWKVAYQNRFFTECFIKPVDKPILMLKDFKVK
ncbi:MAG: hypothetical protein Q8910_00650 [Bacteroidota bacterium]|nr:hypothetical protein [Bacteroidota bacterium]